MQLGFFTMPIHPVEKDWRQSLREDREAFILADELGYTEGYVGEHATDRAENITSCAMFICTLVEATRRIKLGTGTINMPNAHPVATASQIAMLDHLLDGRFIFGISPGGLLSDAEAFGNLDADRRAMFLEAINQVLQIWQGSCWPSSKGAAAPKRSRRGAMSPIPPSRWIRSAIASSSSARPTRWPTRSWRSASRSAISARCFMPAKIGATASSAAAQ
jgi:alkanesulfonate monooxygenase SsuD/methylene tetrahydromethanopterin reductase-like flavin-dependent oxidoreductase (luciferase family)